MKPIDLERESPQGRAIIRAHEPWLELAAQTHGVILVENARTERGQTHVPGFGAVDWELETPPMPSLKARLRCQKRHVIGYVAHTSGSADALLYLKLTETLQQLRDQAAEHLGPDMPFNARASLEPRPVTCRLLADTSGARPAWCASCKRQHLVDLALITARLRGGSLDVTLTTTSL